MNKAQAIRIAIVGSLALSLASVGASNAATSRPKKSAASRPTTTVSQAKKTAPSTRSPGSGAASLIVSGFVSDTLTEVRLTTPRCHPNGAAANAGFRFDGPNLGYVLTFFLPIGTTTLPSTDPHQYFVNLARLPDESPRWTIGGRNPSTNAGTAIFDGAQGTLDLEMIPNPPNSAFAPIHVKGSFTCAYGP